MSLSSFKRNWSQGLRISAKTDIRVRVFGGKDNNSIVSAGFDLSSLRVGTA